MHFKVSSVICLNLDQSKILSSGNGLKSTCPCVRIGYQQYPEKVDCEGTVLSDFLSLLSTYSLVTCYDVNIIEINNNRAAFPTFLCQDIAQ